MQDVAYWAMRLWIAVISKFPVEANLQTARLIGVLWRWIMPRHYQRALEHLRLSFPEKTDAELERIAAASLQHFAQLYLVELVMTPQLVNLRTWSKYLHLGNVGPALRVILKPGPKILITPHFGNFELVGYTLATLGIPITAIMRPLDDERVNDFLVRSRAAGGVRLLNKQGAMAEAPQVLHDGGILCFIADQDAGRKGVFANFFHRPASWYKSISLLAMRYHAPIIVGGAVRLGDRFRYRLTIENIITPADWQPQDDPVQWITEVFAAGMERLIRQAPEQYLWQHRRWKTQPEPARS